VAVWKAVAEGERAFTTIAVVTENGVSPCGACRQVLAEFAGDPQSLRLIVADAQGRRRTYTLAELLPEAFTPDQLPKK